MHNCMQPNVLACAAAAAAAAPTGFTTIVHTVQCMQSSVLACAAAAAAAAAGSDGLRSISSGGRGGRPAPLDD